MGRRSRTTMFSGHLTTVVHQHLLSRSGRGEASGVWQPAVNVYELEDCVHVCLDLAGVAREHLHVQVEPDRLLIEGTRRPPAPEPTPAETGKVVRIVHMEIDEGPFRREIPIPGHVQLEKVQSTYRNGMLCIRLPLQPRER